MSSTEKTPLSATDSYQYTALEYKNSDFRLLTLLKGSGLTLKCKLSPESLYNACPPYEALSYAWGSSELVECIIVDQKPFWITDNLYAALQSLRLRDRDRILWIDAICINQEDKVEQSHQVQQMGQIYERAEKVLIWLGKATPQIIALMKALNQLRDIGSGCYDKQETLGNRSWKDHSNGIKQLLSRDWFTRVWILQEVAKAHRADVCCGVQSIPAETFVHALALVEHEPPPHCKPVLDIMAKSSRSDSWWAQPRDLRTLLHKFQRSKATDERDKIYALLGMSSDSLDTENIVIDYRRPTSQVVHEVMTYLLQPTQTDQSNPFTISNVLDIMCSFTTLNVVHFFWGQRHVSKATHIYDDPEYDETDESELYDEMSEPHQSEFKFPATGYVNDSTMLLCEERPTEDLANQKTCYSQVVELLQDQQSRRPPEDYDTGLRVVSWGNVESHVKMVVIYNMEYAMARAALRDCDEIFRQLLYMSKRIGEEGYGAYALQKAVERGSIGALQLMLDAGVNINAHNSSGSALEAAARVGNEEILKMLLKSGADVNAEAGKYIRTALMAAARFSNKEIVRILLDAGADINAQGGSYGNALQAAINENKIDIVQTLLDAGADVNASDDAGWTALRVAVERGGKEIVEILLDAGADVNAQGGIALQAAAGSDNEEIVRIILDAGADVNAQGGRDGTALQSAAAHFGKEKIVRLLLDVGADVNGQGGRYGTALQAAAESGKEGIVRILLDAGADVNIQGGKYGNALQAAGTRSYNKEILKMLLEAGADVNAQGGEFGNALQAAAARYNNEALLEILLDAGADVHAKGGFYGTALEAALNHGSERMVKILLDAGADPTNIGNPDYSEKLSRWTTKPLEPVENHLHALLQPSQSEHPPLFKD